MTKEQEKRGAEAKGAILSPEEIAALRQKAKETSAYYQKAFAHLRPENRGAAKKND